MYALASSLQEPPRQYIPFDELTAEERAFYKNSTPRAPNFDMNELKAAAKECARVRKELALVFGPADFPPWNSLSSEDQYYYAYNRRLSDCYSTFVSEGDSVFTIYKKIFCNNVK